MTPESQSTQPTQQISLDDTHCSVAQMKEELPRYANNLKDPLATVVQQITLQLQPSQSNVLRCSIRQKLWFPLGYEAVYAQKKKKKKSNKHKAVGP